MPPKAKKEENDDSKAREQAEQAGSVVNGESDKTAGERVEDGKTDEQREADEKLAQQQMNDDPVKDGSVNPPDNSGPNHPTTLPQLQLEQDGTVTIHGDGVEEHPAGPGSKEIRVPRKDGTAFNGIVVPDESSEEQQILRKRRDKMAEEYHQSHTECPVCHVVDGVREGTTHCNSCGASWRKDSALAKS